jgi:hypothetical protein
MDATPEDAAAPLTADTARSGRWREGQVRKMPGSKPYFDGPRWTKMTGQIARKATIKRTREHRTHRPLAVMHHH